MTEQTENTAANAEDVEKNTEDINQENAAETAENEAPAQEAQDVSKDPEALTIVIQDLNKKLNGYKSSCRTFALDASYYLTEALT